MLEDHGLTPWPKTSGSRGFHIYARIHPHWPFKQVRLAAETVAREVERRAPDLATARWWKEERGARVFVDFNQNAKDRTVASAYSVRAKPDARVSTPLRWDEVSGCRPEQVPPPPVPRPVRLHRRPLGRAWIPPSAGSMSCCSSPRKLGPPEKAPKAARKTAVDRDRPHPRPRTRRSPHSTAWKASATPPLTDLLAPTDVLVDGMRGPSSIWYRIRINLQHVPEDQRPAQEELIADYSPWEGYSGRQWRRS